MLSCARKLFHINSCLSTTQKPLCLNRKLSLLSTVKQKREKKRKKEKGESVNLQYTVKWMQR